MSVVCVDTHLLFWAIIGRATPGTERLIPHASGFMKWLEQQQAHVMIPTIVVGELLVAVPDEDRPAVLSQFSQDWLIVDYNLTAAAFFAHMRRHHIIQKRFKDLRALYPGTTRKELVADVMIIATAMAHGAEVIYSHDKSVLTLAEDFIRAEDFLDVPIQLDLPENDNE